MDEQDPSKTEVISSGVSWFSLSIRRGTLNGPLRSVIGLILHVHADAAIEKFMQTFSDNQKIDVSAHGPLWVSLVPNTAIEVYKFRKSFPAIGGHNSNLNYPGLGLLLNESPEFDGPVPNNNMVANLGILRIVGISNPGGVQFGLAGPYSKLYVKNASTLIIQETKRFLEEYLVPININLRITSQS